MKTEKPGVNWFEVFTKTIPIIVAISSFLWGIYQFNEGRRRDALALFHQKVWAMRVETYESIAAAVGKVMKHRHTLSKEFAKAKADFEELYYGGMVLVESEEIDKAMVSLKSTLEDYHPEAEGHEEILEKAALRVVDLCEVHILEEKARIEGKS
jgi:hypothetical protein